MVRLLWGVLLGILIGGALAAILVKGLGVLTLTALAAYATAVMVGVVAGVLAGKPIWARSARIEAGLKAFFGGLVAVGLMFALRTWAMMDLDLSKYGLGHGALGMLPAAVLPLVAVVLCVGFEIDNLFGDDDTKKRVASSASAPKLRAATPESAEADDASEARQSKRRSN